MKKKGFTLIELLATIVIVAAIDIITIVANNSINVKPFFFILSPIVLIIIYI